MRSIRVGGAVSRPLVNTAAAGLDVTGEKYNGVGESYSGATPPHDGEKAGESRTGAHGSERAADVPRSSRLYTNPSHEETPKVPQSSA